MRTRRMLMLAASIAAAIGLVAFIGACGGDDDSGEADQAQQADDDFVAQMTAHHEAAIEMAELAQERGQQPELRQLADAIVAAQTSEIDQMAAIHERIVGGGIEGHEHGTLGLSEEEMGVHGDMSELESAQGKQFDRAFIDSMIPHHQGAIRMARAVHEQGSDEEVAELAQAIIDAQSREIEQMNQWRQQWYGAPSPAGGVPPEGEGESPSNGTMEH